MAQSHFRIHSDLWQGKIMFWVLPPAPLSLISGDAPESTESVVCPSISVASNRSALKFVFNHFQGEHHRGGPPVDYPFH